VSWASSTFDESEEEEGRGGGSDSILHPLPSEIEIGVAQYLYYHHQTPPLQQDQPQIVVDQNEVMADNTIATATSDDNGSVVVKPSSLKVVLPSSTSLQQTSRALQFITFYMIIGMIYSVFHNNNNNNTEEMNITILIGYIVDTMIGVFYDEKTTYFSEDHQHEMVAVVVVAETAFEIEEQTVKWYDSFSSWLYDSNIAIR